MSGMFWGGQLLVAASPPFSKNHPEPENNVAERVKLIVTDDHTLPYF